MSWKVKCTTCGAPATVPALQAGYESHGDPTDYAWQCGTHRKLMKSILGTPSPPGRPPKPKSATQRARELPHTTARHRSEAPRVAAPRPWKPTPPAPSAPRMPRPGA